MLSNSTQLDLFELFFTRECVEYITEECNRQVSYYRENNDDFMKKNHNPTNVTVAEIYTFFGISLLMTRCKKLRLYEYWSTDPLLSTPIFARIMRRDRFFFILKISHFCDNALPHNGDKLYKLRYVIDYLRNKFKQVFSPFEKVCINKSLVLFKGKLSFRQYIPSKRHRFGVKLFMLCDCKMGFCLDFIVYTGSSTNVDPLEKKNERIGKSGQVVTTLMNPYLNRNHTIYLDNWYNSPTLSLLLHDNKTNSCGTIKKNRKFMSKLDEKFKRGEMSFRSSGPALVLKWCEKRDIYMITTLHDYKCPSRIKQIVKQACR
ncbi:hypothetical protein NQ314_017001 [Rhamnusium bicolor]|uniref:PiggyBac transposable element-derived protein domain-containing protein n=1 Tax=Rhamnusium bicolor TaxID=1586634 RepID=A0AAV8WUM5_9CUCU|nr:hypothetical protein NQ314_017001 [Rhamnusium bicolor]